MRPDGVNVRAEPGTTADRVGKLAGGEQRRSDALVFGDYSWLRIPWQGLSGQAWLAGEYTDFPRSRAYTQAVQAWYESGAVLRYRQALVRDLLQASGAAADQIAGVAQMAGESLRQMEDRLTRQTVPAGYVKLWQMREHVGLPDPFEFLPVHTSPPVGIETLELNGFGPNSFAHENWAVYYEKTRGLHSGLDYILPEGSPLIAVADGVIVDFRFLGETHERTLALRPYLPEQYRTPDGARVLSNVIVAYGHLTGEPTSQLVRAGSPVHAGQIIGTSGWPVYTRDDGSVGIQHNNAHLHLEIHLVTDGQRRFGSRQPFNPLLFWSPRLIALQARLAAHGNRLPYPTEGQPWGRLGFFSLGCFRYEPPTIVWDYEPKAGAIWPEGVYDLGGMIKLLGSFAPYPVTGSA